MVSSSQAYLIHSRKYTDSKLIIELLTEDFGKISGVLRIPNTKKQPYRLPQVFHRFFVSWKSSNSLASIQKLEKLPHNFALVGRDSFCGLYVNELVQRLCVEHEDYQGLFDQYEYVLNALAKAQQQSHSQEQALRLFEFYLLEVLGYGFDFNVDVLGEPIELSRHYVYEGGFSQVDEFFPRSLSGEMLRNIAQYDWNNPDVLRVAKHLTREALRPLLGSKPLYSRELFF